MAKFKIQNSKKINKIALMTHIVSGYPDLETSEMLVLKMAEYADYIEIQIPFSDPMADGPVIMAANQKALNSGIKVKDSIDLMTRLTKKVKIPLLFMCYYNTIFNYGEKRFCEEVKKAGCYSLIVPDLPPEEGSNFFKLCQKYKLKNIFAVAPTSTEERLKLISKWATGFIYCMARIGVTGSKTTFSGETEKYLNLVKKYINLPVAVGFGIKSKEQIKALEGKADIAVIGSALISQIGDETGNRAVQKVENFLEKLRLSK